MDRLAGPLLIILVYAIFRIFWRPVTVLEYQRGIKYVKGQFVGILNPGRYWVYSPTTRTDFVDIRPRYESIPGQEVLSSDGVTLKLSLVAVYEVVDPAAAVNKVQDYSQALYLVAQTALRSAVGSSTIDEVMEARSELGPRLTEAAGPLLAELGLRLVSLDVKDIMLPGEVKKLFTQITESPEPRGPIKSWLVKDVHFANKTPKLLKAGALTSHISSPQAPTGRAGSAER